MNKTKNKFTIKIMFSYLMLGLLTLVAGYFITSEIKVYVSSEAAMVNDTKLLKTGTLFTELYQAESLSKLALQSKTSKDFKIYTQKIDSIFVTIDSLKLLTDNDLQRKLLDSVQGLLKKKVFNSNELLRLKQRTENNSSIEDAILEFSKIEQSMGKIPPEGLNPNYFDLPPEQQNTLKAWADYLSENVPKQPQDKSNAQKVDSAITASKYVLNEARQKNVAALRRLAQKEMELNRADLEISQQLRVIISTFEQEVLTRSYEDNLKKEEALKRSIRLAGAAALLGLAIVGLFTFLITNDYWKVQLFRQQLEKEKKFSESLLKSREQLISTVSHDLRTPLNTITGYSELMETTGLSEQQASYLKNVKSASLYVDHLVNDLLDFSKLEAGKIILKAAPFILADLLTETAENLRKLNANKEIALKLDIDDRFNIPVLGDAFRIRQILTNLIGNAYKFTDIGYIHIRASIPQATATTYHAKIEVIDSGIGIKKEKQIQIFKEFTQADDHTDKKYGGYGLGLTISKKLTELLKGKIHLKSEVGKGSTFIVEIPLEISKFPLEKEKKIEILPQTSLAILIIDDDTAMLKLLKEVCHYLGLKAHTFHDFNAIKKNAELEYDLILTDIQMPTISGFEVLKKFRNGSFSHYGNQPIVAMTGRKDLKREQYLEAGFVDIMQKPFAKDQFIAMLVRLFPATEKQVVKKAAPEKIISGSNLFSLDVIASFLGEDRESLAEILHTFLEDTQTNLEQLYQAMGTADISRINHISHRMLPMFRQLKSEEIVPILEELEILKENGQTHKELQRTQHLLKNRCTVLILAIKAYLATDLSYID